MPPTIVDTTLMTHPIQSDLDQRSSLALAGLGWQQQPSATDSTKPVCPGPSHTLAPKSSPELAYSLVSAKLALG